MLRPLSIEFRLPDKSFDHLERDLYSGMKLAIEQYRSRCLVHGVAFELDA